MKVITSKNDFPSTDNFVYLNATNVALMYDGARQTITDWIKTAPIDEVKKINLAGGGPVKNRPKEPKGVKKLNIADYFTIGRTVASLNPMEREVVSTLVKKMLRPGNPQDN